MKNMGLQRLVCVRPQCDLLGDEARMMAVGGVTILENCVQVDSLSTALNECERVVATSHKPSAMAGAQCFQSPRSLLPWLVETMAPSALVFGPERRGLSNEELVLAHRFLSIPAHSEYPVLNLAQAVAICCYELQLLAEGNLPEMRPEKIATNAQCDAAIGHAEEFLQQLGMLDGQPDWSRSQLATWQRSRVLPFRNALQRAQLTPVELKRLRNVIWVAQRKLNFRPTPDA
eukprot:NODE_4129_length_858_cov_26.897404_g3809_i0.p1 GENE.NODE_4129_length_858_cov_26.897404_g3809_i0~~NODE_4129_length_858_cov_26.897404_g3809_i0.p1  ORF type:complete len:261 (-),score=55.37 NODE_4129_length_858_cov_26.897404_g3809_i0:75-767(-)